MPNDPESTITVSVRKQDYWKPWFGDRTHFERLARLCETVFESQRARLVELAADLSSEDYDKVSAESKAKDLRVEMMIDDGTRTISGSISALLPSIDFPHTEDIRIQAEIPSYPFLGLKAKLRVHCVARLGMKIEVESNDEAWVAQAYTRLTEEAGRRRPWWANMKNYYFTAMMNGLVGFSIFGLSILAQLALDVKGFTRTWWIIAVPSISAILAASVIVGFMPMFEVHAEGGKSRRETFLFWLLITMPSLFLFGILINLLTDG